MQTGIRNVESEAVSEQTVEQLDEEVTPLGINFSHPPNVAEIKPFVDEASKGRLVDSRRMLVDDGPKLRDGICQRRRDEKISQPQRGKENLAHGARVNNASAPVQSLQAGQWRAAKAELGVVIIFQDVGAASFREVEQSLSPFRLIVTPSGN